MFRGSIGPVLEQDDSERRREHIILLPTLYYLHDDPYL